MSKFLPLIAVLAFWPSGNALVCFAQDLDAHTLEPGQTPAPVMQSSCACKKIQQKPPTGAKSGTSPKGPEKGDGNPSGAPPCGTTARCYKAACFTADALRGMNIVISPTDPKPAQACPDQAKAEREDGVVLLQAQSASFDKDWATAESLYVNAMKSCVPHIAAEAKSEYGQVRSIEDHWYWGTPVASTIARRFARYPANSWLWVLFGAVCLVLLVLWLRFRKREFSGDAHLVLPMKLTDDGLPDLFAAEVYQASQAVDDCLKQAGRDYFAGALNLVSAPSANLESLTDKLPEISGVSVGKWLSFMLAVPRYFSWRVESWQGFIKSGDAGMIRARALLCRGGRTYKKWDLVHKAADKFDLEPTAFALAARLKGEAIFGSGLNLDRTFSGSEGFCLFMEGLRALEKYGAETNSSTPDKRKLDQLLEFAITRLRECAEEYPEDMLSQFYLGIALTIKNQTYYVERIYALRDAFAAWGKILIPQPGPVDLQRTEEQARPARELARESWSLLNEAIDIFAGLGSRASGPLKSAADYNLAIVYGRLGKEKDIQEAQKILKDFAPITSGPVNWISENFSSRRRRHGDESRALALQAGFESDILGYWLAARGAVLANEGRTATADEAVRNFERTVQKLDEMVKAIESSSLPDNIRRDLEAELWCKRGYLRYEMATHPEANTSRPDETSETHLKKAVEYLEKALEIKPNWNPAQVYLALVLEVMGQRDRATELFRALRGTEKHKAVEPPGPTTGFAAD